MKILIVDDHAIVRGGLRRLLATLPGADLREAETGRDALQLYREERPDITLLDLNLLQPASGPGALGDLSERELEILRLLGEGHSLADIAQTLSIAYKTVANTCGHIKTKLGVARTADLIRLSIETGIS